MAAILKLRRGTSFTSLQESELFYDTVLGTIHLGDGGGSNTTYKTLVKLNESNSGSLHILSDITGSHISASGDITASNLSLVGDADIMGNITLGGDIFLGDGTNATDNINVNASFSGSLIPTTTSVFTLGTDTKKYLDLRVVNATIDNINLPGSGILSSSVTDFTDYSQSVDNRLDVEEAKSVTLETVTSSLDNRLDVEEAKSATLSPLTASYDSRLSNLQITSASHDNRLDVEEAKSTTLSPLTASYDNRLSNLQITSASHDGRLDVEEVKSTTLETVTSSLDVRLDVEEAKSVTLETVSSSFDNRLDNLELDSASQDGRLDNLELESASQDNRLDVEEAKSTTLETVTSSLDTRLDNVESYTSSFATDTVTLTNKTINGSNNTLTVDISRDTNLAVSDTTEVNMILTNDTISAELIGGVVSGSSQINADTVTNFDSNVKTKLDDETVVSGSSQVNYSGLSGINNNIISASSDTAQVDMIINDGSISANLKGGVVSGSTQIDYSALSGINNDIVSASTDSGRVNFTITDGNISADLIGGVVTGSIQVLGGSTILSSSNENFNGFSSSVDSRLDTIEGPLSTSLDSRLDSLESDTHTHANKSTLDGINQGLSTSDNVTFADGDFTGDVQVTGNLTVLGAATEISSTELRIEDKLITVASGSTDSAAADGAGIEIDGAGKSLKWDHNTTSFVLNAKVSSSVGFKGEGGELTGIDTDQVTEGSNLYYTDTRVKTKLDVETVISGSSQVVLNNANKTGFDTTDVVEGTNLYYTDARVKAKLDTETVVSGSTQIDYSGLSGINNDIVSASTDTAQVDMIINDGSISANLKGGVVSGSSQIDYSALSGINSNIISASSDTSNIDMIINGGSISANIKGGIVSSSAQISGYNDFLEINGDSVLSSSAQISIYNKFLEIDGDSVFSSSVQVNANTITNFDSNVKAKLDAETVISGSSQVNADTIINFDSNVKAKLDVETVVSGSSQIDIHSTDGYVANEHIDHSSITIGSGKGLSGGGTIDTNRSLSLDSGSVHFSEGVKKRLDAETVISGSSQVNADTITNFDSNVKTKLDAETVVSGSAFSSPSQGTVRATINGVNTDVDTGLQQADSPTFNTLTLSSVAAGGSTDFDVLFDVSGLLKKRTIGTAAFLNVSASIADDPNSIPTTKAVNDALVAAGAGDITAVNSTTTVSPSTTGIVHTEDGTEDGGAYGNTGNIVIAIDTGSAHFVNAVQGISPSLPSGVVSGSSQVTKTKGDVGLGNVDNESKATMFTSPTFTGTPISTTPADNDNSTKIATTAFVMREVSDLLGGAPAAFDTLLEISSSIANGDSDIVSLTATVGGKLAKASNLSDLGNAGTARTNLGVDAAGTDNSTDVTLGNTNYLSLSGQAITGGTVPIGSGGTGATSAGAARTALGVDAAGTDNSTDVTLVTTSHDYLSISGQAITLGTIQNDDLQNSSITINGSAIALGGSVTTPNDNTEYSVGDGGLTTNDFTNDDHTKLNNIELFADVTDAANVLTSLPAGIVSGSSQVSYNSITNKPTTISTAQGNKLGFISVTQAVNLDTIESNTSDNNDKVGYTDALVKTKLDVEGVHSGSIPISNVTELSNLTAVEGAQLENIGSTTISATQWGYLGGSDQNVKTNSDVTFASASLSNVVISGNLTVLGDAVELGVSELTIEDKTITVASGSADSAAADGAGIIIAGADESITWNHANTRFNISDDIHVTGTIKATDDIIAFSSSDRELKNNIQPIPWALDKINKIGGYSFDWNEDKQDIYKGTDIGVIAQEIEEVLPELVQTRENGYKAVKYDKLVSLLIEGIKDLSKEVDELRKKIDNQ